MLDIFEEMQSILRAFEVAGVGYALCGGLAMTAYGLQRATIDVDLLVLAEDMQRALAIADELGYDAPASPMRFRDVIIERRTKLDPEHGDFIPLDLIQVTPSLQSVWSQRVRMSWGGDEAWILTRDALIAMKRLRGSKQDQADIEFLENPDDAS